MLQAGYLEDRIWGATLSRAPQGGVVSPILSNIYLHRLDHFVERILIPQYTRGERRVSNPAYKRVASAIERARKHGDREKVRELRKRQRLLPSLDPQDPGYRRLRYIRYADDHLLGFTGPKSEAEKIKARLARFLREDLKLELNQEKTLITHASTGAAKFLG
jgi:retron-type reverse transcriptase